MAEKIIDVNEYISDDKLKEIGYTRERFQDSNLKMFWESMLVGIELTVQDETRRLMKEYSLSYGEARNIAYEITRNSLVAFLKQGD